MMNESAALKVELSRVNSVLSQVQERASKCEDLVRFETPRHLFVP
jgi:hypothetical protein